MPGAERALAGVAGVVDHAAAEHHHLDVGIEQDEIDRRFGGGQGGVVLGVQVARVGQLEQAGASVAGDARCTQVCSAAAPQLVEVLVGELRGSEHRLDQVASGPRVGQDLRGEDALGELGAAFVSELPAALLVDLRAGRDQARDTLGCLVEEIVQP